VSAHTICKWYVSVSWSEAVRATASECNEKCRDALVKRNVTKGLESDPVVFTLPKHSELAPMPELKPVEVNPSTCSASESKPKWMHGRDRPRDQGRG